MHDSYGSYSLTCNTEDLRFLESVIGRNAIVSLHVQGIIRYLSL